MVGRQGHHAMAPGVNPGAIVRRSEGLCSILGSSWWVGAAGHQNKPVGRGDPDYD